MEFEIKNTVSFTLASLKNEIRINLTRYTQDLYEENYETLMKKINEELNKWRNTPCSQIERLNTVKMSVVPNLIYRFNAI